MKDNLFDVLHLKRNVSEPHKSWNDFPISLEKDLQTFFYYNMFWLEEIICKIFDFTKIDFLDFEYRVRKKRFDIAFRHGEDIIIVEIKKGYNAHTKQGFYQLQEYEKLIKDNYCNKVYKVLITTHLTPGTIDLFKKENNRTGIVLLKEEYNVNKSLHYIDFSKTRFGFLGVD